MNTHNRARRTRAMLLATTIGAFAIAAPGTAQTATPPSETGPSASPTSAAGEQGTPTPSTLSGGQASAAADAIVVTGFRQSLRNAIDSKRTSDSVVETISAEDLGKLPDNSIADSLARLPGITTQRLNGRAQVISIRGFSPDFSTTLLNGREQVSTGDSRAAEYDQYPSEIINRVSVYKTPYAGLIGQGLSGTVDLDTIRPLSYNKPVFSVSARGSYNDNGILNSRTDDKGYRLSSIWVDQFLDDRLGVSVGVAYEDTPTQTKNFNSWGYASFNCGGAGSPYSQLGPDGTTYVCAPAYAAAQGNGIIGGSKAFVDTDDLKRLGVNAAIDYKATDKLTLSADGFYSNFREHEVLRGVELPLYYGGGGSYNGVTRPGPVLQPGYTVSNGLITNGVFDNVKGVVRNNENTHDSDLYAAGLNATYKNEGWTAVLDGSYSGAHRNELILETYSGTGRNALGATDALGFQQNAQGAVFSHNLNYGDPNLIQLTSPQGWGGNLTDPNTGIQQINGQDGYYNNRSIEDNLYQVRGSLEKKFDGPLSAIQIGANYTDRKKTLTPNEFFLSLKANTDGLTSVPVPAGALFNPSNSSFDGLGPIISYNPIALANSGIYNFISNPNADVASKGWSVHEKITTGWIEAKFDAPLFGQKLTGNLGLQIVNADQIGYGQRATGSPATQITGFSEKANYTDFLPSLNLALRLQDDFILRIGAARQLVRPRLDDMNPSINFSFNTAANNPQTIANGGSPWSGGGGNAQLRPWRANAVDVTLEKYFKKDGYLEAAFFYKDLVSYIYQSTTRQDFAGLATPGNVVPLVNYGYVTIQQNGQGGDIYGFEFSGTLPFSMFHPALTGFGLTGSFSYTISQVSPGPGQPTSALPGYSRYVTNVTGYYERGGFSIRGSVSDRSSYVGELTGFGGGLQRATAAGEAVVDAQIGYEFKHGPAKGLGILFQAQNITDEPFETFQPGASGQIVNYLRYGRVYLFGATFKL